MPVFPGDLPAPDIPPIRVPATPEVVAIPDDLPTIAPDVVVELPLSESVWDAMVVPAEHHGEDVLYLAVSQQRVNVWAAAVYFAPEAALGVCALLVLFALRKLWVGRRFVHRKGEQYCKKCLAGLTGVASDDCPECGRPVAKTRRVAKRSRKSPLNPTWCWVLAAVLVSLGTATLWFGESWYRLWNNGLDLRNNADWWALIDPVDRKSPVRINSAATWLDWRSARLAAYARDRDHAWIESLHWEYKDGEGVQLRLLVRRYDTTDGALLGEDMLPADSYWQDDSTWGSTEFRLHHLAGVVLVDDYDAMYRYRHGEENKWVKIGQGWDPDSESDLTQAALTADGRFLVYEHQKREGDSLFADYIDPTLTVYDLGTGEAVAMLRVYRSDRLVDRLNPTLTPIAGSDPPTHEIHFAYDTFIPFDAPGKLALVGNDTSVTWDYLNHTLAMDGPTSLWPERLRNDLILPNHLGGLFASDARFLETTRAEFNRQTRTLQHRGIQHATLDTIASDSRRYSMFDRNEPPWDHFNYAMDIPVYDLDNVTSPYQPDRIIRIDALGSGGIKDTWLSHNGRWLHVGYPSGPLDGSMTGSWLRIDMESGLAVGWFSEGVRDGWTEGQFVNGGSQFLVVCEVERQPASNFSQYDRVEIHLYHMPDE